MTTTDQPFEAPLSNSSVSNATTAFLAAAASVEPAEVKMTISPFTTTKVTGWMAGRARSVKTIRPSGTLPSRSRHSCSVRISQACGVVHRVNAFDCLRGGGATAVARRR